MQGVCLPSVPASIRRGIALFARRLASDKGKGNCDHSLDFPLTKAEPGFAARKKLLILNGKTMRAATTLIALLSFLSAPIASAPCSDCCQRPLEHQLASCHHKAHAHLGPHVHHMNHVRMVTRASDGDAVVQPYTRQFQNRRLSCHSAPCLRAKTVHASVASIPASELDPPAHLTATPISGSDVSDPLRPPRACLMAMISTQSASAPLRI